MLSTSFVASEMEGAGWNPRDVGRWRKKGISSVIAGCKQGAEAWVQLWQGGDRAGEWQGQDLQAQGDEKALSSLFAKNRN